MEPPMNDSVRVELLDRYVVRVALNRPEALNALNTRMAEALRDVFTRLSDDAGRGTLRAVVLTGTGSRAFCSGADLKERQGMTDEGWRRQHEVFESAVAAVASCPVPVIAAVNGVALGGGHEIALACDFIIASDAARFGQPEVGRGIMPGLGGTQRLPRRIGEARAKELLFTGRTIDAREAIAWGVVNEVVPPASLMTRALEVARSIAANAPAAVRHVKAAVEEGAGLPLDRALARELDHYRTVVQTEDRREGVAAFNEKRPPRFQDR
jgi:enoyl-CoA hydratase/carnithine racemase